jgi:putrescine transport system ATP-binding protein
VQDIAYLGDMSVYLVRLDSGREVRVTQTNRTRKPEEQFKWEESVYLVWDGGSPVVGMG